MTYMYIALFAPHSAPNTTPPEADVDVLHEMGLRHIVLGPINLFVSRQTPTLRVPSGGIVVGHLRSRDGEPIIDPPQFPDSSVRQSMPRYMLENYWGDYLFIQPATSSTCETFILRDPSGGVSCLYSLDNSVGFVTSDISLAIRIGLCRRLIDWDFIAHCASYPNLKTERTGLSGVRELLPGCSLSLRQCGSAINTEWSPWTFVSDEHRHTDPRCAACSIREAVSRAVKAWAEADRGILLALSGGLDSSILASCLGGLDVHTHCCTFALDVSGASDLPYAEQVAEHFGFELTVKTLGLEDASFRHALPPSAASPCLGHLQQVVNTAMETCARSYGATNFFTGGGGDTVFAYLSSAAPAADAFLERGFTAGMSAVHDLSALHQCTLWKAGRLTLRKLIRAPKPPCKADTLFLNPSHVIDEHDNHPWLAAPTDAYPGDRERIADLIGTQVFRDDAPWMSCSWLRMPLLSQPVVEECLKVPTWMAISGGKNRSVARRAFSGMIPPEILNRKSKGSFTTYLGAVYNRHKEEMLEFLLAGRLQEHNILDVDALIRFVRSDLPLHDQSFARIGELCMIENWARHQE